MDALFSCSLAFGGLFTFAFSMGWIVPLVAAVQEERIKRPQLEGLAAFSLTFITGTLTAGSFFLF
ncbi:hypothetical protein [Roseibacillus ishigakijimensis]|uniref:Uncharacterized protein n=1 Tax=Roseibacillus ishigakijimensis TaxID=454146 RepID=A0A934RMJ2_9BACT|nr:hypothetical protein [Roseibacillus ishigakijimensis]MBK1833558.1 hypothetical protein [Roseibacillus ishigakijimensis]